MPTSFIMVDYENIQPANLGSLSPSECAIKLFAGEHQTKVDLKLARAMQQFGGNAEYIQIHGKGKDALDFHIAFYIGRLSAVHPGATFTIVSKDTGFDPLVRHMGSLGIPCVRRASIDAGASQKVAAVAAKPAAKKPVAAVKKSVRPASKSPSSGTTIAARAAEVLKRLGGLKAAKPVTVKTLRSSVRSWFKPALSESELDGVIRALVDGGHMSISGTKLTYSLKKG